MNNKRGLFRYLQKNGYVRDKNFTDYSNKTVCIDLSIFLHQIFAKIPKFYLKILYFKIKKLLAAGIRPVFVLDRFSKYIWTYENLKSLFLKMGVPYLIAWNSADELC